MTLTAAAIAEQLGLLLFVVRLDGLLTKFLGETAAKLRMIFNAIDETRGVYLFDEFDALGGERSASNDVGEMRRVLNSFLQFLEDDGSDSIIIGATNHAKLLERALFRRFDIAVNYDLSTPPETLELIRTRLGRFGVADLDWSAIQAAAKGLATRKSFGRANRPRRQRF